MLKFAARHPADPGGRDHRRRPGILRRRRPGHGQADGRPPRPRGAHAFRDERPGLKMADPIFDRSAAYEMLCFMGPDVLEGAAALTEKRAPRFPSAG